MLIFGQFTRTQRLNTKSSHLDAIGTSHKRQKAVMGLLYLVDGGLDDLIFRLKEILHIEGQKTSPETEAIRDAYFRTNCS